MMEEAQSMPHRWEVVSNKENKSQHAAFRLHTQQAGGCGPRKSEFTPFSCSVHAFCHDGTGECGLINSGPTDDLQIATT